jgi:integrase
MIERWLIEPWGALALRDITRRHVHEVLDHAVSEGLTIGVNRLQALISRIFTIALDRGHIDAHPAARLIKRFKEQPRDRVLTDDELRALWAGLDARPGTPSDALRLRLLLGQRGEEIAGMQWSEVDLDTAAWLLPARRTKNARPHVVALPATALELIRRRRELVPIDQPRVFPDLSLQDEAHSALSVIHGGAYEWKDLRRTVATRLAEIGFDETIIGRTLNHAKYTVTARHYNKHAYIEEVRQALAAWDVELQRILANEPKTARVLPMRAR